jgi:hypothetical protein
MSYPFTTQVANPNSFLTATSSDDTDKLWSNLLLDSRSLTFELPQSETWTAGAFAASAVVSTGWRCCRKPASSAPEV